MADKRDIRSMTPEELTEVVTALGEKAYRAGQIFQRLHRDCVTSFDDITTISKAFRGILSNNFEIFAASIAKKLVSEYDSTVKYLFRLHDGAYVESVVMRYKYGLTVCVSTQVGCNMGCRFCASTLDGKQRDLTASEILAQLYAAQRDLGENISHIVLMGMGEPLDNYDNVLRFLRLVTDERGQNKSMRNISLSTCGIVPKMYALADENLGLTLSVSLHAPNDEIRQRTMPVAKRWSIEALLKACRDYTQKTGRRISFEYAMVDGVNDSDACAYELADRLAGMLCHVNLIPVNEVAETRLRRSKRERIDRFRRILEQKHINVTVRRHLGADINASCGQLRRQTQKQDQETAATP